MISSGATAVFGSASTAGAAGLQGADESSGGGIGIYGSTNAGSGVHGQTYGVSEVYGGTGGNLGGVVGDTDSSTERGVLGRSSGDGPAVKGVHTGTSGTGVTGTSSGYDAIGVVGIASGGQGCGASGLDTSPNGTAGVNATSTNGVGLTCSGGTAPILRYPASSAGPPTIGVHSMGELSSDNSGGLSYCVAAGTPGTWLQVPSAGPSTYAQGAFCLLPAPIRLLDTRPGSTAPDHPATPVPEEGRSSCPSPAGRWAGSPCRRGPWR